METTKLKETLPGPIKWPIFGSLFYLTEFKERVFMDWVKHYGNIYEVKMGSKNVVVVNGYEGVKAALNNDAFSSRDSDVAFQDYKFPGRGIFFCPDNEIHRRLKPFLVENLSELKSDIDKKIETEIVKMIAHIKTISNKPVDIQHVIWSTQANILLQTLYTKSFEYGNAELENIMKLCRAGHFEADKRKMFVQISALDWMKHLPSSNRFYESKRSDYHRVKNIFRKLHEERQKSVEEVNDLSSAFAKLYPRGKHIDELLSLSDDVMVAGTLTVRNQTSWILLELLRNPAAMKKVEEDIKSVFPSSPTNGYLDSNRSADLHYCRAVVEEGLRLRPAAPTTFFHYSTRESALLGYRIPMATNLQINLWSALRDPDVWAPDPDSFRPERHLDENGRFNPTNEVVTFGGGRRKCGGFPVAKRGILSLVVNLIGNFEAGFEKEDDLGEGESLILYAPPKFNVHLKLRE